MTEKVTVTYGGVEITYQEAKDNWTFELDGKERFAKSLLNAKAAIDSPERKTEKKPFKKFSVYHANYTRTEWEKVEVTSFTEDGREAWVTRPNGRRTKENIGDLFPLSAEVDQIRAEMKAIYDQQSALYRALEKKKDELKSIKMPKGE